MTSIDPALLKVRAALDKLYGGRVERVALHGSRDGSRARGGARPDSDYEAAMVLEGLSGRRVEAGRVAEIQRREI